MIVAKRWSLRFYFSRYDVWIGAYWDRIKRALYISLIPMCVVRVMRVRVGTTVVTPPPAVPGKCRHMWREIRTKKCVDCDAYLPDKSWKHRHPNTGV